MTQESGYTLLELLVVLAIMAITLVVIPGAALSGINAARFSGKLQNVSLGLERAHEEAIDTGHPIRVTVVALSPPGCRLAPYDSDIWFYPDGSFIGERLLVTCGGRSEVVFVNALTSAISVMKSTQ